MPKTGFGTSLPPQVEGQLRCFLSVKAKNLQWSIPNPPNDVQTCVLWWGEKGKGSFFKPEAGSDSNQSEIHFPIRCGPKQFQAYVQDMALLRFDIVDGATCVKFGRVDVKDVGELRANNPIHGSYDILCVVQPFKSKKVGTIDISISFKTISDTYNVSSSIVPTTDKEFISPKSPASKRKKSVTRKKAKKKEPTIGKHVQISQKSPERIDYSPMKNIDEEQDISFVIGPGARPDNECVGHIPGVNRRNDSIEILEAKPGHDGEEIHRNEKEHKRRDSIDVTAEDESSGKDINYQERKPDNLEEPLQLFSNHSKGRYSDQQPVILRGEDRHNILSGLLEKGQRLRDEMIKSSLNSQSIRLKKSEKGYPRTGDFLKTLMNKDDEHIDLMVNVKNQTRLNQPKVKKDIEQTAVNLLLGSQEDYPEVENLMKKLNVSEDSVAMPDESCTSELSDPLHDSSLLSDLFYTTKINSLNNVDESSIIFSDDGKNKNEDSLESLEPTSENEKTVKVANRNSTQLAKEVENSNLDFDTYFTQPINIGVEGDQTYKKVLPDSISVEKLTALGRVKSAKCVLHNLEILPTKLSEKLGLVYFIELNFPVTTDTGGEGRIGAENVCCVSKNLKEGGTTIVFDRISVFPITFNESMVNYWWNHVLRLKCFVKYEKNQKHQLFGVCEFNLRDVFLSDQFNVKFTMDVYGDESGKRRNQIVGKLEISIELAIDQNHNAKLPPGRTIAIKSQDTDQFNSQGVHTPIRIKTNQEHNRAIQQNKITNNNALENKSISHVIGNMRGNGQNRTDFEGQYNVEGQISTRELQNSTNKLAEKNNAINDGVLQNLVMITQGRDIQIPIRSTHSQPSHSPNLYCVSRVFWSFEIGRTKICWNTYQPCFQFQEIVPVPMSDETLGKMRNNMMVIEVWNKSASTAGDKNPFYMYSLYDTNRKNNSRISAGWDVQSQLEPISFVIQESEIDGNNFKLEVHKDYVSMSRRALLWSLVCQILCNDINTIFKYPVISIDDWLPVIDVFSGQKCGLLKVLHAIGTHDQVMELLSMKGSQSIQNLNHLDLIESSGKDEDQGGHHQIQQQYIEHNIDVTIEGVRDLFEKSDEVWGETDCFIQYQFPQQVHGQFKATCFKTKTTLCVPNQILNHTTTHTFHLPTRVPLQNTLLQQHGTDDKPAEVTFELWERRYYPNIRDQCIAKTILPLAKLCAIISMHHERTTSSQSFHLPLHSLDVSATEDDISNKGSVDVFISYSTKLSLAPLQSNDMNNEKIGIAVSILRMCGLKGLLSLSKKLVKYAHGLNAFVRFYVSFAEKETRRETSMVARSFCPIFSYHVEFSLPLLEQGNSRNVKPVSLAERMESGHLVCELYHRFNKDHSKDEIVAECKIPLIGILSRNSSIRRWFPLKFVNQSSSSHEDSYSNEIPVCGIEVHLKLNNFDDKKRIINTGRSYGWCPSASIVFNDEAWLSSKYARECNACQLNIKIDGVWIPGRILESLLPGMTELDRKKQYLYARYKFYDKAPVVTTACILQQQLQPTHTNKRVQEYTCVLKHRKHFEISPTTSFAWYLHEETMEIQFWLTSYAPSINLEHSSQHPHAHDILIGASYVPLRQFSHSPYESHSVSGFYHLFKSDSDDICDVRARISLLFNQNDLQPQSSRYDVPFNSSLVNSEESSDGEQSLLNDMYTQTNRTLTEVSKHTVAITTSSADCVDSSKTSVCFQVEKALHLQKYLCGEEYVEPLAYVTCSLPDTTNVLVTETVKSTKPNWNHRSDGRVDVKLLKEKRLEFKVWRCVGREICKQKDLLIGTAQIDTSPLFYGLKQINGWYNIHDFNGRTMGQIKVAVIPSIALSPSTSAKYFKRHELIDPVNLDHVFFSKHTSGTFNRQCEQIQSVVNIGNSVQNVESNSSSQSMLFEQLKAHLDELGKMTSKIKERTAQYNQLNSCNGGNIIESHAENFVEGKDQKHLLDVPQQQQQQQKQQQQQQQQQQQKQQRQPFYLHQHAQETLKFPTSNSNEGSNIHSLESNSVISNEESNDQFAQYGIISKENTPPRTKQIPGTDFVNVTSSSSENIQFADYNPCSIVSNSSTNSVNDYENEKPDSEQLENEDNRPDLNDSTDELLEHLRDFEQKYKHLKDLVQNDSDFEHDEVMQHIENNLKEDERFSQIDQNIESSGGSTPSFQSPRDTFRDSNAENEGQRIGEAIPTCDEVVNVSSTEPSKEDIKVPQELNKCNENVDNAGGNSEFYQHDSELQQVYLQQHKLNQYNENFDNVGGKDFQQQNSQQHRQQIQEDNQHQHQQSNFDDQTSDEIVIETSGPSSKQENCFRHNQRDQPYDTKNSRINEPKGTPVTLPNFFMRPQELAQSMKALRIAANFRNSPRNSTQRKSSVSTTSISSQDSNPISIDDRTNNDKLERNVDFENQSSKATEGQHQSEKRQLQERLHHQLPIEASEMARIASIFSSKE